MSILPPTNVTVAYRSARTTRVSWTNSITADSVVLERGLALTGPFTTLATLSGTATSSDDATVALSTQYFYRLRAVVGALSSMPSMVGTTPPPPVPSTPVAPTALTTSNVTAVSMRVSWNHPGTNVDGFLVERKANYTNWEWVQVAELPPTARSFDNTCLRPSATPYVFRITAYNAAGRASVESSTNTATLSATTAPTIAPSNLHATPVGSNAFRVEWTNGCSTADRVLVELSVNNGPWASVLGSASPYFMSDATWFLFTDVPPNTTYRFRVSAGNQLGFSATTPSITVGPLTAPGGTAGTVGIYPDFDNTKIISDLVPSLNATVSSMGGLTVGCFWLFNTFLGMQDFNCYSAALHFPLSGSGTVSGLSFNLAGKTIDRALLVLSVSSLAVDPTQLSASAIASNWDPATLNGNVSLNLYTGTAVAQPAPTALGPFAFDVTAMVRQWVSGAAQNHGVLLEDANYVFPMGDFIRTSFFFSVESYGGLGFEKNRPTLWVDYH